MFCEASDSTQMRCTLAHVICRGDIETTAVTVAFGIYDCIPREEAASVQFDWPETHIPMPAAAEPLQQCHGLVALSGVRFPAVAWTTTSSHRAWSGAIDQVRPHFFYWVSGADPAL